MTHFLVKMTEEDAHRIKSALCEMVDIAPDELHKAHALMALGLISKAWRGRSATACYAEEVQAKLDAKAEASKVMMVNREEMRNAAHYGGLESSIGKEGMDVFRKHNARETAKMNMETGRTEYPKGEEERIGPPGVTLLGEDRPMAQELSEPAPTPPVGYGAHLKPIDSILDMPF
jgi:hypothetical protein